MNRAGEAGEHAPLVLAVASGKGGTGKTLVATNVAVLAAASGLQVTLVDCDVEAPNDHLFLHCESESVRPVEVLVAEVDAAACTACGACRDACAFGAARLLCSPVSVFEQLCHGCSLCEDVCPTGAIHMAPRRVGEVVAGPVAGHPALRLVTGRIDVGHIKSPAVIGVTRHATAAPGDDLVIIDAPPGVACSAVAALRGADVLLLVTEPTAFGVHDLELSFRLGRDIGFPMGVVVNRDGVGATDVDGVCRAWDVPIVARVPFDRRIARAYAEGFLIADEVPEVARILSDLPQTMRDIAQNVEVAR